MNTERLETGSNNWALAKVVNSCVSVSERMFLVVPIQAIILTQVLIISKTFSEQEKDELLYEFDFIIAEPGIYQTLGYLILIWGFYPLLITSVDVVGTWIRRRMEI